MVSETGVESRSCPDVESVGPSVVAGSVVEGVHPASSG